MQQSLGTHWSNKTYLCLALTLTFDQSQTLLWGYVLLYRFLVGREDNFKVMIWLSCRTFVSNLPLYLSRHFLEFLFSEMPISIQFSKCFWNQLHYHASSLNKWNTFWHVYSVCMNVLLWTLWKYTFKCSIISICEKAKEKYVRIPVFALWKSLK